MERDLKGGIKNLNFDMVSLKYLLNIQMEPSHNCLDMQIKRAREKSRLDVYIWKSLRYGMLEVINQMLSPVEGVQYR